MTCEYCKRNHSELSCPGCGAPPPPTRPLKYMPPWYNAAAYTDYQEQFMAHQQAQMHMVNMQSQLGTLRDQMLTDALGNIFLKPGLFK